LDQRFSQLGQKFCRINKRAAAHEVAKEHSAKCIFFAFFYLFSWVAPKMPSSGPWSSPRRNEGRLADIQGGVATLAWAMLGLSSLFPLTGRSSREAASRRRPIITATRSVAMIAKGASINGGNGLRSHWIVC
jgi:hypothetical protein